MVAAEASPNWGYDGQMKIAQVMVNRVISGHWGSTMRSVLSAPHQFTPWAHNLWQAKVPTATQIKAVDDVLAGKTVFGRDVLYFCTEWAYNQGTFFKSLDVVSKHGNVYFMR